MHCPACGFDSNNYECILDLSLEVGGGICTTAASFARAGAHVTVVELSPASMALCRRRFEALGLQARGGVVRVSMAHYNTAVEIDRLIQHLDEVLP